MKDIMQKKARFIGQCMDILYTDRQPDDEEPMPQADEDTCGGKASGKGTPLRVPQVGGATMGPDGTEKAGSLAGSFGLETCQVA